MLLRYYIEGIPRLEVVDYAEYNESTQTGCFYSDEAVIMLYQITNSQWFVFINDMFVDGKLALGEDKKVERVLSNRLVPPIPIIE